MCLHGTSRWLLVACLAWCIAACGSRPVQPGADLTPVDITASTVLVAGGSGRVGGYVIAELQAQGIGFRATTRSLAEARQRPGPAADGIDWIEADVRDPAQVDAAMRGVDLVISVIGSRQVGGENGPEFVDYGGVMNLVDAAVAHGVQHFVLLTAIGVTDPLHPFNKATKGALEWRYKGEQYLRASGLRYTVVRPGGLVNSPAGERGIRLLQGDDWRPLLRATLSRGDLAQVLVESLRNTGAAGATFEIVNDPSVADGEWREAMSGLVADP